MRQKILQTKKKFFFTKDLYEGNGVVKNAAVYIQRRFPDLGPVGRVCLPLVLTQINKICADKLTRIENHGI